MPARAKELRKQLPSLERSWLISYFAVSFPWQGDDIPWQGSTNNDALAAVHWSKINYRDAATFGDPKNIWELNRHQFLRHWVLNSEVSRQERANAVSHLALHWIEKNPYNHGMNWTSSLELALRLMSWQSCLAALGTESFDSECLKILQDSVFEHSRHLQQHPSLYSSANNHRVGELLGELAAAVMFPQIPELFSCASRAWEKLQMETRLQVTSDGICREQAFYYHAYTLLYLKRAAVYAEALSFQVPAWYSDLTVKMQEALDSVTDNHGNWFEIGDRDDGDLHALQPLHAGPQPISVPADTGFHFFQEGGYAIWKSPAFHLLFRCGEFGYPSIAAHAHCDQLSVLLKMNDQEILTDSGTGSYHDNEIWRRYFRGTTAHNTVVVNDEDQAEYGGPFLWNTAAAGVISEAAPEKVTGSTTAWLRGSCPVLHQRTIYFQPDAVDFLHVQDILTPESQPDNLRKYQLIWNFGPAVTLLPAKPDTSLQEVSDCFCFHILMEQKLIMQMTIKLSSLSQCAIYHGDESVPAGFYSRQFGQRIPITQLRITASTPAWQASTLFSEIEVA